MKLAIGFRVSSGPWGGGNRFVKSLAESMLSAGHEVSNTLEDPSLDIILIVDPRWRHPNVTFSTGGILRYLMTRNKHAIVVHRINECDERKNTQGMNQRLKTANYCADHTVFVGGWLRNLNLWDRRDSSRTSVITNGADTRIFNSIGWKPWLGSGPLHLVTHHWGNHWMKGFDVYAKLDQMLVSATWKGRIKFTYIGNLPAGFRFKNARHIQPLDGHDLASELRRHHGYVTGSINEPGGNHQNEGALCGLPLLYRESGCLPEYCNGYGVSFSFDRFEMALEKYMKCYADLVTVMPTYPHTAENAMAAYHRLFNELVANRDTIVQSRNLWRSPFQLIKNQLPM